MSYESDFRKLPSFFFRGKRGLSIQFFYYKKNNVPLSL